MKQAILWVGILTLCACATTVEEDDQFTTPEVDDGLEEREPDTCDSEALGITLGQNKSVVPDLGLTRPYRVLGREDIATQEYNPARVNFYTNDDGIILRVSCG
ncbi:hypothetical protein IV417_08325 [Alphaproteobacteria bacterium KMM 3653]|uniref:Peptidase inhibitor I78 family protein n=1 Tax=Harenicola maris TaxID=2841044 RepID=A0AAP2G8D9_9RHOB|nr:hypothetical protein [Harenicola maris]